LPTGTFPGSKCTKNAFATGASSGPFTSGRVYSTPQVPSLNENFAVQEKAGKKKKSGGNKGDKTEGGTCGDS